MKSDKKVRACLAIDGSFIGGGHKHVLTLSQFLKSNNFDVSSFVSEEGPFTDLLRRANINYQVVPMGKWPNLRTRSFWRKKLHEINPEILHLQGGVARFWGRWAKV